MTFTKKEQIEIHKAVMGIASFRNRLIVEIRPDVFDRILEDIDYLRSHKLPWQKLIRSHLCLDWEQDLCVLVYEDTYLPIKDDAEVHNANTGLWLRIDSGRAPHKAASTGHVFTSDNMQYYPSVFGLKWVKLSTWYEGYNKATS